MHPVACCMLHVASSRAAKASERATNTPTPPVLAKLRCCSGHTVGDAEGCSSALHAPCDMRRRFSRTANVATSPPWRRARRCHGRAHGEPVASEPRERQNRRDVRVDDRRVPPEHSEDLSAQALRQCARTALESSHTHAHTYKRAHMHTQARMYACIREAHTRARTCMAGVF